MCSLQDVWETEKSTDNKKDDIYLIRCISVLTQIQIFLLNL